MMSKSGSRLYPEINPKETYLLIGWHPAYRWHDLNSGFSMERGNLMCDVKRKPYKCRNMKRESIDANMRGGSSCSSIEVSVMEMERRGCANLHKNYANQKWEEHN